MNIQLQQNWINYTKSWKWSNDSWHNNKEKIATATHMRTHSIKFRILSSTLNKYHPMWIPSSWTTGKIKISVEILWIKQKSQLMIFWFRIVRTEWKQNATTWTTHIFIRLFLSISNYICIWNVCYGLLLRFKNPLLFSISITMSAHKRNAMQNSSNNKVHTIFCFHFQKSFISP